MDILIDTQILIWSFDINSPFSKKHKSLLEDTSNRIFVSQISLMELAIKKNINKLPGFIPDIKDVADQLLSNGSDYLDLQTSIYLHTKTCPYFKSIETLSTVS